MTPFSSPQSAARDVRQLLDYLWAHHEPHFLYRGQIREYPGPLLPSAYRGKRVGAPSDADEATAHGKSMRGVGKRFCEVRRFRNFDDIFLAYSGEEAIRDRDEVSLLWSIAHHDVLARIIGAEGFEPAIRSSVRPDLLRRFEHRLPLWQRIITAQHKGLLRLNGANQFFGFQVGQTLAQHYVESSEFLDATRSPTVAAFFANYPATADSRQRHGARAAVWDGIGIIYRFVAPVANDPPSQFDYYSTPAYVDAVAIARKLEITHLESHARWSPEEFVFFYKMTGGERDWRLLALTNGSISGSRIGRQEAAFVVPDEVHEETRDPNTGDQNVTYQAIEDLSCRSGVERFYFLRSQTDLGDATISEDYLWPSDEAGERALVELFHAMVDAEDIVRKRVRVLGRVFEPEMWYPARHDLIREQAPNLAGRGPVT
jgi:hypothetical protein